MEDKKRIRVMLVDDEITYPMDLQKAISAALAIKGRGDEFSLAVIGDEQHAAKQLREGQYDVLITDNRMDGITGIDLAKIVRARESNPNIPIIMVTKDIPANASPTNPVIIAAQRAGVDKVVDKFQLDKRGDEFLALIDRLIAEKAQTIPR